MKKDSNEERENRTVKQNKNLNIKIDLERGKVTGYLGSGNQNLPPSKERCNTPAKMECCLEEKKFVCDLYHCENKAYNNNNNSRIPEEDIHWMVCGLVGKEWNGMEWKRKTKECMYLCIYP